MDSLVVPFLDFYNSLGLGPKVTPADVAGDCFGLLRIASGCFGLLLGPKVAPATLAGARSSLDSRAAAAISNQQSAINRLPRGRCNQQSAINQQSIDSRAAAARSQAPPLPPDDLRMLDPRAGLQVDGIVSPSGAEALRAPAKAFLGPGGGTAHVRLLLCAEAAARLPATLPGEDGHAAGHVEGAPSKPMSAALGSTPDDNDANPLARILDEIRFT